MKISKVLFDDPRAARNVASTMHEAPRESKAWFAWMLLGMLVGASLAGIGYEYKERYRGADVRMSPTHSANTTEAPR
jgi:hypothetical protein